MYANSNYVSLKCFVRGQRISVVLESYRILGARNSGTVLFPALILNDCRASQKHGNAPTSQIYANHWSTMPIARAAIQRKH